MTTHIVLTIKQAARIKGVLLKAVELLGGADVPSLPAAKPRKVRKPRTPKDIPPSLGG